MNGTPQVLSAVPADLLRHLSQLATTIDVPIQWMVAGLVCDTIDTGFEPANNAALLPVPLLTHASDHGNHRWR